MDHKLMSKKFVQKSSSNYQNIGSLKIYNSNEVYKSRKGKRKKEKLNTNLMGPD